MLEISIMEQQKPEFKPCPFCGKQPDKTPRFCMGYAGDGIACRCGAETPKHLTDADAVKWWNRRA